jgi:hypothetical protein
LHEEESKDEKIGLLDLIYNSHTLQNSLITLSLNIPGSLENEEAYK